MPPALAPAVDGAAQGAPGVRRSRTFGDLTFEGADRADPGCPGRRAGGPGLRGTGGRPSWRSLDRAGVSIASVSRVLNGKSGPARHRGPRAGGGRRARLRSRRHRPGYLKLGATMQVAFAVDDVGNPVYTGIRCAGSRRAWLGSRRPAPRRLDRARPHPTSVGPGSSASPAGMRTASIISPLRRSPELVRRPRQRAGPRGGRG